VEVTKLALVAVKLEADNGDHEDAVVLPEDGENQAIWSIVRSASENRELQTRRYVGTHIFFTSSKPADQADHFLMKGSLPLR